MRARRPTAGETLPKEAFVYVDSQVVVVQKPAGMSTVPYDETETDTLVDRVHKALKAMSRGNSAPPGIVHRLDKETSGLILFARTLEAKRELKKQFRVHSVHRRYVAIAHGFVAAQSVSSRLVRDRGDGRRGSTDNPTLGRDAITHVGVLERLDGATLVECRLETGRTHQIRIHLAELGHPLLGETLYLKGFTRPDHRRSAPHAPRARARICSSRNRSTLALRRADARRHAARARIAAASLTERKARARGGIGVSDVARSFPQSSSRVSNWLRAATSGDRLVTVDDPRAMLW